MSPLASALGKAMMTAVTSTFNHRLRRRWSRDRHLRCLQRAILLSTMTRQRAPITLPKVRTLVEIQSEMLRQRYLVFDHDYDVGVTKYLGELGGEQVHHYLLGVYYRPMYAVWQRCAVCLKFSNGYRVFVPALREEK
jgi:hypothetical protein